MAKKPVKAKPRAVAAKKPGQALAIHKPQLPAAPVTFMQYLDRWASDPNFEPAKFQIVLAEKRLEDAHAAEARYDEAMALAQAGMKHIRTDMENKQTKSRYASYPKLDAAIRPIYSKHGFAVSFDTEPAPFPDYARVVAFVSCSGHKKRHSIDIPADGKGAKGGDVMSKTHATTSAVTTGMRNLMRMIFNLVTTSTDAGDIGHDDDGNAASGTPDVITPAQRKKIDDELKATNSDANAFLYMLTKINGDVEIKDTGKIPASLYAQAIAKLEQKRAAMGVQK